MCRLISPVEACDNVKYLMLADQKEETRKTFHCKHDYNTSYTELGNILTLMYTLSTR